MESFLDFLKIAAIVGLPFLAANLGNAIMHAIAAKDFGAVPILTTLSRLAGVLIAGLLLYANLDRSYFDLEMLFIPESRWNIGFIQFMAERANVFSYDLGPLLGLFAASEHRIELYALALVFALLTLGTILFCFRYWSGREAIRAAAACGGAVVWAAWLTVYLVCLVFWALYHLNYWALLLMVFFVQYRRWHHN
jgi:hypothetical protein